MHDESIVNDSVSRESDPQPPGAGIRPVIFASGGDVAIRIEQVWKQYRLGVINHGTLARDLQSWWARLRGQEDPNLPLSGGAGPGLAGERFWALQDVSFDVRQGEVVGIIGKNGAGKSTLLKILSQVTAPTRGQIKIKGRIASLLEVGTGFHPELTGRENVFLNGAILGMNKAEVARKLDEIIAFAEIEKFIDTPVKRYSSGMYVRLAFAVAAHLEPEILVVDEVLAVGDAAFQKKCLGRMAEVGATGRTVLFVSHNMQAIRQLCGRAVHLRSGCLVADAGAGEVVGDYLREIGNDEVGQDLTTFLRGLPEDSSFRLADIRVLQDDRVIGTSVESGKPLVVEIQYQVLEKTTGLRVYVDICDDQGLLLIRSFHDEKEAGIPVVAPGCYLSRLQIPADVLGPARYELIVRAGIFNVRSCLPPSGVRVPIHVVLTGEYNRAYAGDTFRGKLALAMDWITIKEP